MRGRTFMAVAVRAPDKSIVVTSEALPKHLYGGIVQKIPLVRGMTMLWDALGLGMKALMFSADIQMAENDGDSDTQAESSVPASLSKPLAWTTVALASAAISRKSAPFRYARMACASSCRTAMFDCIRSRRRSR